MRPWKRRRREGASEQAPGRRCCQGVSVQPILYIVGDVHLRGEGGEAGAPGEAGVDSAFLAFHTGLAGRPAAHLEILGDLFEFRLETPGACARDARTLAGLRALRSAGWRLDLVLGNREATAGRLLEVASGCRLHWPAPRRSGLPATRLRVVHGDRLCHDPSYRLLAAILRSSFVRAWQRLWPGVVQEQVARQLRRSLARHPGRTRSGQPGSRPGRACSSTAGGCRRPRAAPTR